MVTLPDEVVAGFSGVVCVQRGGETLLLEAYGSAHRACGEPNTVDTRFGLASGAKGLTALTVMALVERGTVALSTTARSVLGADLPLVDDRVTVEQLLAHRSGIGDFVDEEADGEITDYVLTVPVHELATTEDYLAVLDGKPTAFPPGERFAYCNSGYVVLALIAERTGGASFYELVRELVCRPAGMVDTEFLRGDELPSRTAVGYVGAVRSNVLHLPVRGSGDGGVYSTVGDVGRLWRAVFDGTIVSPAGVAAMVEPQGDAPYGLGFWLRPDSGAVFLEGYDAGVSFRSVHRPGTGLTFTVVSNTSEGAWPVVRHLEEVLA